MWEDGQQASGTDKPVPGMPVPDADQGKGAGAKQSDEIKLSKADYDKLIQRTNELQDSERYWAEQAKNGTRTKPEPEKEPEDEWAKSQTTATDKSLIDQLSEEGVHALFKQGIPTKAEISEYVKREVNRGTREAVSASLEMVQKQQKLLEKDAALINDYKDLADPKSELSKRTQENFQESVKDDPSLRKSPAALRMAAKAAAAELKAERRGSEADRLERVRRQSGDVGSRRQGDQGDDDADEGLSPMQRRMLDKFNAEGGVQISDEAYTKRAKDGVRMSSKMAPPAPKKREVGDWA